MDDQVCDLILKAPHLIVDSATAMTDAAVAVKDGTICAVGASSNIERMWTPLQVKEMKNACLMPGLINAHTHVPMTFLRGFADDLPLMEWLTKHIFPVEAHLTREIVALGARMGMYEMMRTGTTAFVDSYLLEESVLSTAEAMGMRAVCGEVAFAFPSPAYANWMGAEQWYRTMVEKYPKGGRIQIALMPHSVYTTNDDILRACVALGEELDIMCHIHLSESAGEIAQSMEQHAGRRPIAYAHDMGLLTPRTVLAHMVEMTDEELDVVAQSGAQIVHNPVSNLKLASGVARIGEMKKRGISVALGTDGACSNNTLDMFETMKWAALLAKGATRDASVIPAPEALSMATVAGARIFRTPGLGTLTVGAPADVIALDMSEPNMAPLYTPISHVVYAASGKDCLLTLVDGKVLYEKGTYLDGQYEQTRLAMADLIHWVKEKADR